MEPIMRGTGRIFYCGYLGGKNYAEDSFFFIESMGDNLPNADYSFERERKKNDTQSIYVCEYVISGKGYIECDGRHYDVKAGDFYFLNRLYSHSYWSDKDEPYHKIWINAGGSLLDGLVNACGFTDGAMVVPDSQTYEYFERVHETLADATVENATECVSACAKIMCELLLTVREEMHSRQKSKTDTAEQIKAFIDSGLCYNVSLDDIVRHFYLNKSYIISIFGKKYGTTPKRYILERKMQAARTMLEEDEDSIAEIADRLHFSSSQHFSLAFKRSVGVSPEAYRKAFLAKQKSVES